MIEYEIDGKNFSTLEEFYEEISRVLFPGAEWGRNLDAFNEILRGGHACARAARRHWAPRVRRPTPRRPGEVQPVTLKADEVYEEPAIAWSV